jgi:hypothetical protein
LSAITNHSRSKWFRLALGVALSAGALWLALRKTSLVEIGAVLAGVHWQWLPLMIALKAAVLGIKDLRWRVELEAVEPGPYHRTFRAIGLGYFGNIVLPFKLGEFLRVGLLKRHNPQVSSGATLATIAAERALDGAVLALMVGAALSITSVPPWVLRGTILLMVAMLGVIALSIITPAHNLALRLLPQTGAWLWARRVVVALTRGTAVLREPRALLSTVLYTAAAWLGESLVFWMAIKALGLPIGYANVLVVTLLMSVGLLIPSAPGQIGTHQALTLLFLQPFGVTGGAAVSVSLLLQAVALFTLGSIGGYVLVREAGARELVRNPPQPGATPTAKISAAKSGSSRPSAS